MPAIGITGGVATGKTTFCESLRRLLPGAKLFDADRAAHELVDRSEIKSELANALGREIFLHAGNLNRAAVRAIVFGDAAKRRALEQILHPRIRRQWSALAETHRDSPEFFLADIPLLYETEGEKLCDRVVVVACSTEVQVTRLMHKKSIGREQAEQIMNAQIPLKEKIRRADHVVWNNGASAALEQQARLLAALWRSQKWTKS